MGYIIQSTEVRIEKLNFTLSIVINEFIYVFLSLHRYPSKTQYTCIINGILNRLGIEHDTKKAVR